MLTFTSSSSWWCRLNPVFASFIRFPRLIGHFDGRFLLFFALFIFSFLLESSSSLSFIWLHLPPGSSRWSSFFSFFYFFFSLDSPVHYPLESHDTGGASFDFICTFLVHSLHFLLLGKWLWLHLPRFVLVVILLISHLIRTTIFF